VTVKEITNWKGKRKLTMLTAYDFCIGGILDECEVDMILVGDSLGMVVLGNDDTKEVTLDDMIRHGAAVVRGCDKSLVIVDMPISTYENGEMALENARKILDETCAEAVKIEGRADIASVLVENRIPVVGHTGLKPQEAEKYGVVGREEEVSDAVLKEAKALAEAGCFCVVLECVPSSLAAQITREISVPTIGIGAGKDCDGQVLVINDMLGMYDKFSPKFVRKYADLRSVIGNAVLEFKKDVENNNFPSKDESFN
jgi:3-methyl-2-oxobutanoate hydroxymethyltransferase